MDFANYWFSGFGGEDPGPGPSGGNSLRFRGSQKLSRTFASDGNRLTWTFSCWVKKSKIGGQQGLIGTFASSNTFDGILFAGDDSLQGYYQSSGTVYLNLSTSALFRDPSAWHHVMFTNDSAGLSGKTGNYKFYINGVQQGITGDNNTLTPLITTGGYPTDIGWYQINSAGLEGYMADVYYIDGQALEPTAFGNYNDKGVWVPAEYTGGNYGVNGFHLDFSDPADIGADRSGNDNDFTATGFDTDPVGIFSNDLTTNTSFDGGNPPSLAFDGNTGTFCQANGLGGVNASLTYAPTNPIGVTSLEVFAPGFTDQTITFGGTTSPFSPATSWVNVPLGTATEISTSNPLVITRSTQGEAVRLCDIRVNGVTLVDNTGTDYDLMLDSPTQNYATLNPLAVSNPAEGKQYEKANLGLIAGNLPMFASTIAMPNGTGIYYWELQNKTATGGIGVCSVNSKLRDYNIPDKNTLITDNGTVVLSGTLTAGAWNNGAFGGGSNQVYGCQYNSNTRRVRFYVGGQQPTYSGVVPVGDNEFDVPEEWGDVYAIGSAAASAGHVSINYGQQPFLYQPAGTVALQTQNLPAATIANGRDHFRAITGPGQGAGSGVAGQLAGNWSADLTVLDGGTWSAGPANAFDGSEGTQANTSITGRIQFAPTTPITVNTSLEVLIEGNMGADWNGNAHPSSPSGPVAWQTIPGTGVIDTSTPIILTPNGFPGGSSFSSLNAVRVDGQILVDANILAIAQQAFPNGLWWIKDRVNNNQHQLVDSVRGGNLTLQSNSTAVETAYVAPSGDSVAWCWKAGGAAVTNNDGSIASQVSANTDAGFSVVTYTGNGTAGATVGHGLNSAPEFLMIKARETAHSWAVYHSDVDATAPEDYFLILNSNAVRAKDAGRFNDTTPSDTVFTVGNNVSVNNSGRGFIAYAWHSVPGYSAIGSYTGNGNSDGPMIWTGFKVAVLIVKAIDSAQHWMIFDSTRYPVNTDGATPALSPSETSNETSVMGNGNQVDFLSNGFKWRQPGPGSRTNATNVDYIYCAFAQNPFQSPATAR